MSEIKATSKHNGVFWFHLTITILAWIGPFLFSWYLMVSAYMIVLLQFAIFNRCLLNAKHELDTETDQDTTFYSYIFEQVGYRPNRKTLKRIVRRYLYIIMSLITILWQVVLGFEPLLF